MYKTAGEYSMGFKVPTNREEMGDSLVKYSVNRDISPNQALFVKGEREIDSHQWQEDCELNPESRALVQGQMMRYSENKGSKVGIV